ncbi:hypothetical protein [Ligilactobacillus pobuzihii]|uniref:Uncharacterized protein n=1 Tax=Ligilactobacillus pobuzihii TaxID=449659 RepID=A0A0R2LH60_9LACO|nr:hypothetical protein [Ligilactobacillus pobuzihii]KRK09250.1 hypothetical protein FD11_GL001053 [Ligilactobacillus pobuzihii E100301 = KCTC 13174]KRO01141.1 hypothetical protein IV66_GL001108 [Ligilactobacillus pobuzihii]GEN49101.1 hypothetical protein LPO01_18930 [Ligilactobacillus pobuzihii]
MMVQLLLSEGIDIFQASVEDNFGDIYYYDTDTNNFKQISGEIIDSVEMGETQAELLLTYDKTNIDAALDYFEKQDLGKILFVPGRYDIDPWDNMQQFALYKDSTDLNEATHGKGAFRLFRLMIAQKGWEDEWYEFEERLYGKEVIHWAKEHQIDYVDDIGLFDDK